MAGTGPMTIENIEVIEINEAFSAQVVACQQALNISNTQLNFNIFYR
jgi:acetyl-CoA C-acetyltransferase